MSIGRESENRGRSFERGKFYLERRIILRFFSFLEGKSIWRMKYTSKDTCWNV